MSVHRLLYILVTNAWVWTSYVTFFSCYIFPLSVTVLLYVFIHTSTQIITRLRVWGWNFVPDRKLRCVCPAGGITGLSILVRRLNVVHNACIGIFQVAALSCNRQIQFLTLFIFIPLLNLKKIRWVPFKNSSLLTEIEAVNYEINK